MTRKEYIEQLPKYDNAYGACTWRVGLDSDCYHEKCSVCLSKEATINGQPATYLFACPVKPGQTVYQVNETDETIYECKISYIFFTERCWAADCTSTIGFDADAWGELIFPTREAAEKRLEELKS